MFKKIKLHVYSTIVYIVTTLGGLDKMFKILLLLMFIDILFGFAVAWKNKVAHSGKMWTGATKKAVTITLLLLTPYLSEVLEFELLYTVVATYFIVMETISVLEHAKEFEVYMPKFVYLLLDHIKERSDEGQ